VAVLFVSGLATMISSGEFANVTCAASTASPCPSYSAANSNLQTALTGADTFYSGTAGANSYSGLYGGNGVSTITGIDTALSYVTRSGSSRPNVISLAYGRQWLVMTAYAPGVRDCWVVTDVKVHLDRPVTGQTKPGVSFGVLTSNAGGRHCTAARAVPATMQATGFPHG